MCLLYWRVGSCTFCVPCTLVPGRRGNAIVVLRGVSFLSRQTLYVARAKLLTSAGHPEINPLRLAQLLLTSNAKASLVCHRVPGHLQRKHWSELLSVADYAGQLTDTVVLHSSALLSVFSKFEDLGCVHTYTRQAAASSAAGPSSSPATTTLVFELPRFNLEFQQATNSGTGAYELVASDYSGYCLATQQQLVRYSADGRQTEWYTLPEFSQYLVLTRRGGVGGGDVMVLVPEGSVQCVGRRMGNVEGGGVRVMHSNALDARLKVGGMHMQVDMQTDIPSPLYLPAP